MQNKIYEAGDHACSYSRLLGGVHLSQSTNRTYAAPCHLIGDDKECVCTTVLAFQPLLGVAGRVLNSSTEVEPAIMVENALEE